MDHSVQAMTRSHRTAAFARLLRRRRFENKELEQLYQRYIFKLRHASIVSVLALVSLLSMSLAILQFWYHSRITVIGTYCAIQFVAFIGLLVLAQTRSMSDAQLRALCYLVLLFCGTFCMMSAPVDMGLRHPWLRSTWWDKPRAAAEGVWEIVFVVFLVYALLPIKTRFSALFGGILAVGHIAISITLAEQFAALRWQQVRLILRPRQFARVNFEVICICEGVEVGSESRN